MDMAGRRMINHGEVGWLGNDLFICPKPDETGVDCEKLLGVLNTVRRMADLGQI